MNTKDEVIGATLRVIATHGFQAVTIRHVATEVNRSTTVVTHYFANRNALLREVVGSAIKERREAVESVINDASDPTWAFLEWSIDADVDGVWPAVVAASAAGIESEVVGAARQFDQWWTDRLTQLLRERQGNYEDPAVLADAIGVVIDGFVVGLGISKSSNEERLHLLHILLDPLVPPLLKNRRTRLVNAST